MIWLPAIYTFTKLKKKNMTEPNHKNNYCGGRRHLQWKVSTTTWLDWDGTTWFDGLVVPQVCFSWGLVSNRFGREWCVNWWRTEWNLGAAVTCRCVGKLRDLHWIPIARSIGSKKNCRVIWGFLALCTFFLLSLINKRLSCPFLWIIPFSHMDWRSEVLRSKRGVWLVPGCMSF